MTPPRFACPRCGRVSHHPDDAAEGYCGACHDFTGPAVGAPPSDGTYNVDTHGSRPPQPPRWWWVPSPPPSG